MLPLKEKDRPIVKKLLEAGCCARCVLRFCCLGVQSAYRQSYEDTAKELCAFISDSENNKSQDAAVLEQHTEDPPRKKIKMDAAETDVQSEGDSAVVPAVMEEGDAKPADSDVCAVCLGVLQEFCDEAYAIKISDVVKVKNYQFDTMVLSVSLTAQLSVREHSCWLHVKKEVSYIKEFVHGDFGRTKPNLCDLLKTETDILELDVDSVDVDWPPSIPE